VPQIINRRSELETLSGKRTTITTRLSLQTGNINWPKQQKGMNWNAT